MSSVQSRVHPPQLAVLPCATQYGIKYNRAVSVFQAQMPRSKQKSSSGVDGTALYILKYYNCKIKNALVLCLLSTYYLCEKYYKPITVEYYKVNCDSWTQLMDLISWT